MSNRTKLQPPIMCIICNQEVREFGGGMYCDGMVGTITAGYGSRCDGDTFQIGIHDECLKRTNLKKIHSQF